MASPGESIDMARKQMDLWVLGIAILVLWQQMSLADTKTKKPATLGGSRSQKAVPVTRTRYQAPDVKQETAQTTREPNVFEIEEAENVLIADELKKPGRSILTSGDDPVPVDPIAPDKQAIPLSAPATPLSYFDEPMTAVDCPQFWQHRSGLWADYMFMRARGADVTYATPVNGTLATSVPIGERSVAAFDYDSGFRVGGAWAIDNCSSLTANYMWFRNAIDETATVPGGGGAFLLAETVHPNTINVAADSLAAAARYEVNLQSADLNYKRLLVGQECYALNWLVGVKYSRLEQQFLGTYSILGTTTVNTNVNFNGVGPRFGLEGERLYGHHGFMVYSKGYLNFLVGGMTATFIQQNVFTGLQARTGQQDSRIVTVPELELGGGWQNCTGCFRITAGYYLSAWFNMMTTPEYLSIVRTSPNTFQDQIKTLTLDGLMIRAEYKY